MGAAGDTGKTDTGPSMVSVFLFFLALFSFVAGVVVTRLCCPRNGDNMKEKKTGKKAKQDGVDQIFVSRFGRRFHRAGCLTISQTEVCMYEPCNRCRPHQATKEE